MIQNDSTRCQSTGLRTSGMSRRDLFTLCVVALQAGCRTSGNLPARFPSVVSRFSAAELTSPVSTGTIGLTVESGPDTILVDFSRRLGSLVADEIELSAAGVRVRPWNFGVQRLDSDAPSPGIPSGMVNVSCLPDSSGTPESADMRDGNGQLSTSDPSIRRDNSPYPTPDRIVRIQVMDYRPWYPMAATLRLTVLEGSTFQPFLETTAAWSATQDGISGGCNPFSGNTKRRWNCRGTSDNPPAPGHNSPEALLHIIAEDIAAWFAQKTMPASAK